MEPGGRPPPVQPLPGAGWVLVCDDTESIRLLLRINLELEGFEVLEAADGRAALTLLERTVDRPPDVLVLDAQMAPLDGWGTVAAVRGDPRFAQLPVVMVTASLQQQERERSVAAGVDVFVAKPFEPAELVARVRELARSGRPGSPP